MLAGLGGPHAGAGESLAWRFETGESLRYRLHSDQTARQLATDNSEATPSGQTRQVQTLEWTLSALDVSAMRVTTLSCRYDALAVELDLLGYGHMRWDSANAEDRTRQSDPTIHPFAQLVSSTFQFALASDGSVRPDSLKGGDALRKAALTGMGDNTFVRVALGPALSDEAITNELSRAFAVLSSDAVNIGEEWTTQSTRPAPLLGELRFRTTYHLVGIETTEAGERLATLTSRLAIEAEPGHSGSGLKLEGMSVKLLSARGTGGLVFSVSGGHLVRSSMQAQMTLESTTTDPVAPSTGLQAITIRTQVDQTLTVELLNP